MSEVANLTIKIDSSDVTKAAAAQQGLAKSTLASDATLQKLVNVAGRAATTSNRLAAAFTAQAASTGHSTAGWKLYALALEQAATKERALAADAMSTTRALAAQSAAQAKGRAEIGSIGASSGRARESVSR